MCLTKQVLLGLLVTLAGFSSIVTAERLPELFPEYSARDLDFNWFEPIYANDPDEFRRNTGYFFNYRSGLVECDVRSSTRRR